MDLSITLSNEEFAAVTWAKDKHNADIVVPRGQTLEEQPDYTADETAYVQHVITKAIASYVEQAKYDNITLVVKDAIETKGLSAADVTTALEAAAIAAPVEVIKG